MSIHIPKIPHRTTAQYTRPALFTSSQLAVTRVFSCASRNATDNVAAVFILLLLHR